MIAKDLRSAYEPGGRGKRWFKVKEAQSVDCVIIAADRGSGRRRGWLSNYHLAVRQGDGFADVGKTFKGLTDRQFAEMTERLGALAIADDGYTVRVRPEVVVEVAYNEIQKSPSYPSGFALRFARITRVRDDKAPPRRPASTSFAGSTRVNSRPRDAPRSSACARMMPSAFMGGTLGRCLALTALLLLVSSDRPALGNPEDGRRGSRPPSRTSSATTGDAPSRRRGRPRRASHRSSARFRPSRAARVIPISSGIGSRAVHAKSMGPGISGQLAEMIKSEPAGARSCFTCHAPLAEQAPLIRGGEGLVPNPDLDTHLQSQGVVCASCHVRGHQRFGPPRRDGTVASRAPRESLPHNGLTRTTAFLRSEFCASCHQFAPNGLALNGKLLENTFEEWRASPAARRGRQCQDCHMPDRRHLWRGIHDPEMVKSGVQIKLVTGRARYRPGEKLTARLTITSTGVGHDFPTYVTPRVLVRAQLLDAAGEPVPGSLEERAIGREVPLDLSREIADTRIPAGGGSRSTMLVGSIARDSVSA